MSDQPKPQPSSVPHVAPARPIGDFRVGSKSSGYLEEKPRSPLLIGLSVAGALLVGGAAAVYKFEPSWLAAVGLGTVAAPVHPKAVTAPQAAPAPAPAPAPTQGPGH